LKNFTLAGLSGTQNAKYKTALQIYNWHQEAGTTYSVAEIKKKFFTINKNALGKTTTAHATVHHDLKAKKDAKDIIFLTCVINLGSQICQFIVQHPILF